MLRRILAFVFKYIIKIRIFLYDKGIFKKVRIPVKVISVGNISVGGAGKTPLSIWITQELSERGLKTALLEKGYKSPLKRDEILILDPEIKRPRTDIIGDEASMALRNLRTGSLLCVSKSKSNGALELSKQISDLKYIVVDDGFQHLRLERQLDIVLMSKSMAFKDKMIPTGRLREPYDSLKRANVLLFTKTDGIDDEGKKGLVKKALEFNPSLKIFFATTKLLSTASFNNKKILPVSSVADYKFLHSKLKEAGGLFSEYIAYPDHYTYNSHNIDHIVSTFKKGEMDFVVYTSKDAVKIKDMLDNRGIPSIEVWYEHLIENEEEFLKLCMA